VTQCLGVSMSVSVIACHLSSLVLIQLLLLLLLLLLMVMMVMMMMYSSSTSCSSMKVLFTVQPPSCVLLMSC